jgi:hypothetical protein
VSYAALGVAGFAVLVAAVAARISWLSYRASGPRIVLEVEKKSVDPGRIVMAFTVINQGRGEVSIDGFHITPYGGGRPKARRLEIEQIEGDPLPYRLAGNSRLTWFANVLPVARRYDAGLRDGSIKPYSSWPERFYFSVKMGNGKYVHAKASQYGARSLIAEAYPEGE